IRTQRDEVDAIEAFGTFLWDIRFIDFQAEYDLARITWDEARHTEIGHRALLAAGYDPFELRNRLTGSSCRGPMDPAFAMAEINLFGEVGVLKTINQLIDAAADRHDELLRHISDFIRSDERTHVRKGGQIIKVMTTLGAKALEQRTRELFTECLVSLGAVKSDMDVFTVSREDIEHLVGEGIKCRMQRVTGNGSTATLFSYRQVTNKQLESRRFGPQSNGNYWRISR